MLMRTIILYAIMTVCAVAFHENTFAVFELRELLLERTLNLWELFEQLEYVTAEQRAVVYSDIANIQAEINSIIEQLILLDKQQH
jgi:DNA-binding protein H-NS